VIELLLKLLPARNVRVPKADLRWLEGDPFSADAWRELATGELFYAAVGVDARRSRPALHLSVSTNEQDTAAQLAALRRAGELIFAES
jgi:hypothetical protein